MDLESFRESLISSRVGYGGLGLKDRNQEEEVLDETKIFFCSRTHSQLCQFSAELRKVHLPPTFDLSEEGSAPPKDTKDEEVVKHLSLGSRKLLCINDKVNTPSASATTVNERCLDLQQSGTAAEKKCPFLLSKQDNERQILEREFRDIALADVKDIEDLRGVGQKLKVCGYYASREAIKPTEVQTLSQLTTETIMLNVLCIDRHLAIPSSPPKDLKRDFGDKR